MHWLYFMAVVVALVVAVAVMMDVAMLLIGVTLAMWRSSQGHSQGLEMSEVQNFSYGAVIC